METDGMRYIDGEMSTAERAAFEEHLSSCGECRQSMDELGSVERLTGMMKIRDPQDDFFKGNAPFLCQDRSVHIIDLMLKDGLQKSL